MRGVEEEDRLCRNGSTPHKRTHAANAASLPSQNERRRRGATDSLRGWERAGWAGWAGWAGSAPHSLSECVAQ